MKKAVLLFVLILITMTACMEEKTISINPKGNLVGFVTDTQNNPLADVEISVGSKSTKSDEKGQYELKDLDIGNDANYNVRFTKANYITTMAEAKYSDTLTTDGGSGATVNNEGLVNVNGLPLKNAVVSLKVQMTEVITLKGNLKLPDFEKNRNLSNIKVTPKIKIKNSYINLMPKSNYINEEINSLNYIIKDVPRFGLDENGDSVIEEIIFEVYIDGNEYKTYSISIKDKEKLNLQSMEIIKNNEQSIITMEDIKLSKLYSIKGIVYKNFESYSNKNENVVVGAYIEAGIKNETTYSAISNSKGEYIVNEIEANKVYDITLKNYDIDNDGIPEFYSNNNFEDVAFYDTTQDFFIRDLWYDDRENYSISGKVYCGIKDNEGFVKGIKVKMLYNDRVIAQTYTDESGNYIFDNVLTNNVKIITESIDLNQNGVFDFLGYIENNNEESFIEINNLQGINLTNKNLFMIANESEPEFELNIKNASFLNKKADGKFEVYKNNTLPNGEIELNFENEISIESIEKIEKIGEKVFNLKADDIEIELNYSFKIDINGEIDEKTIIISPKDMLLKDKYYLEVNPILSSKKGYKYDIGNNLSENLLKNLYVDIDVENYILEVIETNFFNEGKFNIPSKESNVLEIKFNKTIAQSIVDLNVNLSEVYKNGIKINHTETLSETLLKINLLENIDIDAEYRIYVKKYLATEKGVLIGLDMEKTEKVFDIQGKFNNENYILNNLKPIISPYYLNYNLSDNFIMDYDFTGALYKDINLNSQGYLDNPISPLTGEEGVVDFKSNNLKIEFKIPEEYISNGEIIDTIKEFRVNAKLSDYFSYWKVMNTIKSENINKSQINQKKIKDIELNLKDIAGYSEEDMLKYGKKVYIVITVVDKNGNSSTPLEKDGMVIEDKYAPKISKIETLNNFGVIEPGVNIINFSEELDMNYGVNINISGVNSVIKYKIENKLMLNESKYAFEIVMLPLFTEALSSSSQYEGNKYQVNLSDMNPFYEDMIIAMDKDKSKKIKVVKIETDKIIYEYIEEVFSILKGDKFCISDEEYGIFNRNGMSTTIKNAESDYITLFKNDKYLVGDEIEFYDSQILIDTGFITKREYHKISDEDGYEYRYYITKSTFDKVKNVIDKNKTVSVKYVPKLNIKFDAKDTSGNIIQADEDTFYFEKENWSFK